MRSTVPTRCHVTRFTEPQLSNGALARVTAALVTTALALSPALAAAQTAPPPKPPAAAPAKAPASGVDTVIALVKGGMSEARVIKTLQDEGKVYKLSTSDLLKLQSAGVSEAIIAAMTEPSAAAAAPAATTAPARAAVPAVARTAAPAAGAATPFPPDLADVSSAKKRRIVVTPFDYSTVTTWVHYWFNNNVNIGEGIRAMLTVKMDQSKNITLLERKNVQDVMKEQDFNASNRVKKGTGARIGQLTGADAILYGDIVIFGRDDTTKHKGIGAAIGRFSPVAGGVVTLNKEEKAVVGINLRIVDAETGEVLETGEARGESSRKSKDYAGALGIAGAGAGAGSAGMTSSNFQETIIGEATQNAVNNIAGFLEEKVNKLPSRPREIEGRIAALGSGTVTLNVGSGDGVLRGDRFEILQINGEIKDPTTKDVIDIDAVKIGEFVADGVREKISTGAYGGQPLSSGYMTTSGKGYAARLMSK
jgi:curli biogenesis system outer membrane secretion channel CsgG